MLKCNSLFAALFVTFQITFNSFSSNLFKAKVGVSPLEFRKKEGKLNDN